jgi:hypothetical protein
MIDEELVANNYKRFCGLDGNEYIASEFALETIVKIMKKFNVESILELGLGIGSIVDTVLKYSNNHYKEISYFGTEKNEFCLHVLKTYVEDFEKINVFPELNLILGNTFDLIIIDGYDDTLKQILSYCKKNTMIYIEGDRSVQRDSILKTFPKCKYVNIITMSKKKPYAHGYSEITHFIGGGQLIFINPTGFMSLFWLQQKIGTFIKYRIREYISK